MTLREDITASFRAKGLNFVSLNESASNPQGSTLVYEDGTGKSISKEIGIRLSELEDTLAALDAIDPDDMANFLLQ
jgi:hypothetical protein